MLNRNMLIPITIVYVSIISILALIPNPVTGQGTNYILHIAEFFILSLFIFKIFEEIKYAYVLAILLSLLINIIVESSQILISYRTFSVYDILAGLIGSSLILTLEAI